MAEPTYRIYELDAKTGSLSGYFIEVDKSTDATTKRFDASLIALSADILSKTNTTTYTPTADYHPATKKYVDDNAGSYTLPIATAIALGGIKIGSRVTIDANGVLSADVQTTDISGCLKTDQSTPQTITGGIPQLDAAHADFSSDHQLIDKEYADSLAGGGMKSWYFTKTASDIAGMFKATVTFPVGGIQTITGSAADGETVLASFLTELQTESYRVIDGQRFFYITAKTSNTSKATQLKGYVYTTDANGLNPVLLRTSTLSDILTESDRSYAINSYGGALLIPTTTRVKFVIAVVKMGTGTNPTITLSVEDDTFSRLDVPSPVGVTDLSGKVDKVTGSSLVPDTEISKIHSQNTDSGTTGSDFLIKSGSTTGKLKIAVIAGASDKLLTIQNEVLTADQTLTLPNKTGTLALTTDTPDLSGYLLKAGVSGGQTAIGGIGVTDALSLQGTSANGTSTAKALMVLVGNNGGTEAITVLNNGNVGIGATSPSYKLDVNGNIGNSSGALSFYSGGTNQDLTFYPSGTGKNVFNTNTGANYTSSNVFNNNYAGIGSNIGNFFAPNSVTTSDFTGGPTLNFGVAASPNNASSFQFYYTGSGNGNNAFGIGIYGTVAPLIVHQYGVVIGNTYASTIPPADGMIIKGNVGIGTTGPGARLNVIGADSLSTSFAANISGATGTGLVVANNGNVGIGTIVPTYLLSLSGQASRTIGMERHTTANTAGNNLSLIAGSCTVGATDKNGGTLLLKSATSTGTGTSKIEFYTATAGSTGTADSAPTLKATLLGNGNFGLGLLPTAVLTLKAGTATNAPLQFTAGTLLATPESGVIEFDGSNFYCTI